MKNTLKRILPIGLLIALAFIAFTPTSASAQNAPACVQCGLTVGDFTTASSESGALTSTLLTVTHYIMYVFYLLGIIFMGVAAIKFKNGDMEAMGKNLGGAVCLFLVPKIVEVIIGWAAKT